MRMLMTHDGKYLIKQISSGEHKKLMSIAVSNLQQYIAWSGVVKASRVGSGSGGQKSRFFYFDFVVAVLTMPKQQKQSDFFPFQALGVPFMGPGHRKDSYPV